jgi:Uma2 family endonuclease
MSTQPSPYLTPEQYLAIEREAEFRSEYVDGGMFAMSGGTLNHARIVSNTLFQLMSQLRGTKCEAVVHDLRLHSAAHRVFTYPDIVVICGEPAFLDQQRDTIVDATVIVEVLSPSTKSYDRGDKFAFYRSLPSFADYLLLGQDAVRAEHHARQADGSWLLREFSSPAAQIELTSIGCSLNLGSLYDTVDLEPAP